MNDELGLAHEAIAALLTRTSGAAAWRALERDGWLDMGPESDGWPMVDFVAGALEEVARLGSEVPLAPHYAALALLGGSGSATATGAQLGLLTDTRVEGDKIHARAWGDLDAATSLTGPVDGRTVEIEPGAVVRHEDSLLSPVGVTWVEFDAGAAAWCEVGEGVIGRHEALTAYLLAVEVAAAMREAGRRTVEYMCDRAQFGAALSSYQALQHRAVDMYAASTLTTALVTRATTAWRGGASAEADSWAAKVLAGRRGVWALENAIQIHGGIGFTWELGLHLGLRRAQRARQLLGGPAASGARALEGYTRAGAERAGEPVIDWAQRPRQEAASAG